MTQTAFFRPSGLVKPGDTYSQLTVTSLKFNETNEAFENGVRAHTEQKYDDAVNHYTRALEALQTEILSVIRVHRAAAYEMQNKYDLAAEDGLAANPDNNATCPDAYFARGNALFLNNQLNESIAVYQRGSEVVPKTYTQRELLGVKYVQVSTYKENRNQLLVQLLPYEVLSRILSQLSIKERARLGMTCRFWKDYMFHKWPGMWNTINLEKDFPCFDLCRVTEAYIAAIRGDQVKDLHLEFMDPQYKEDESEYSDDYDDGYDFEGCMYGYGRIPREFREPEDSGTILLSRIHGSRWKGIESLTMTYCDRDTFDGKMSWIVRDSLRALTLIASSCYTDYGIEVLSLAVQNCPNLQTVTNYLDNQYMNLPLPYYLEKTAKLNLRVISLSLPREMGKIDQICQLLPALTSLTIDAYNYIDYKGLLDAICKYCTALEVFNYRSLGIQDIRATHTQSSAAITINGLKTMVLRPLSIIKDANANKRLALILQKGRKTLQNLNLNLDVLECGQFSALDTLAQAGAPQLRTLILDASNQCSIGSQKILNLISACPSLATVELSGKSFWHDRLLVGLANIQHLRRLVINSIPADRNAPKATKGGDGILTTKGFRHLFDHAQKLHDFSLIYGSPGRVVTPKKTFVLEMTRIIGLSTIRSLDLHAIELTSETLPGSLSSLKMSQVRTLKISVNCPIGDEELDGFTSIQSLTHLIVFDVKYHFKEDHVCKLLDRWQYPQMLVVHIRRKESCYFVKGYKADVATTRQTKDQIADPMFRYSIQSSNPSQSDYRPKTRRTARVAIHR